VSLDLPNPVLVASGCGGTGRDLAAYTDLATLGGFVTRSITLAPRAGGAVPRIVETPSGLAHAVDLQNPGIDQFLALELPWLLQHDARVFVSIVGRSLGEYAELARRLGRMHGLAGVEVNLSPPDAAPSGVFDVREPFHAASVVAAVHRDVPRGLPVVAKLRSDLLRIAETAHVVVEAGAEAVVVGNALPAAMPDGRPAGLSGPAIRPLAMRCLTEVLAATPGATVIACGGIATAADARAALDLGAAAVQVGTALLHDPTAAGRLARELAPTGEDEA
jgi:dihydroorotate dehydrogenase (NAD+) catalytic subunit